MQAFLLDLIRSISNFEFFVQPLADFETELRLWEFIRLQIPILSEINIQNLVFLHQIYTNDTTPDIIAIFIARVFLPYEAQFVLNKDC